MRWKEQAFAKSGDDCGLTIAGFYYISLCRQTGDVEGEEHPVPLLSGSCLFQLLPLSSLDVLLFAASAGQLDAG